MSVNASVNSKNILRYMLITMLLVMGSFASIAQDAATIEANADALLEQQDYAGA